MFQFYLLISVLMLTGVWGGLIKHQSKPFVQYFEHSPGLYYERVREVRLTDTDWRTVIYLDIAPFFEQFGRSKAELKNTYDICAQTNVSDCKSLLNLQHLFMKIELVELELKTLNKTLDDLKLVPTVNEYDDSIRLRKRMVPFGFIGSGLSMLVGTATTEEVNQLHDNIETMKNTNQHFFKLLGQQTHVVRSALHNIHEAVGQQRAQMQELRSQVEEGFKQEEISREKMIKFIANLTQWTSAFTRHLEFLVRSCQELRSAIYTARRGELLPSFFTTEQLIELSRSIHHDTISHEFPVTEDKITPEAIANLAKTYICYSEGRILLVLHIPLLKKDEFTLYRMHSLPVVQQFVGSDRINSTAYIAPKSPYIIISKSKFTYMLTDENYFRYSCKQTFSHFICPQDLPLHDAGVDPDCEFSIFSRPTTDCLKTCNIYLVENPFASWTKINSLGGWIFSVPKQDQITISCPGQEDENLKIQGIGLLNLNFGCSAKTKSITLQAVSIVSVTNDYIYRSDLNLDIQPFNSTFDYKKNEDSVKISPISDVHASFKWKYENSQEKLIDLEKEIYSLSKINQETFSARSHWGISCGTCILLLFIILLLRRKIWNELCDCFSKKQKKVHEKEIKLDENIENRESNGNLTDSNTQNETPIDLSGRVSCNICSQEGSGTSNFH